jgi:hypothetical protein
LILLGWVWDAEFDVFWLLAWEGGMVHFSADVGSIDNEHRNKVIADFDIFHLSLFPLQRPD